MIVSLRARRAVFWFLGPDRLVAAVLSRGEREPLLEACAASYAPALPGTCFAPGLLEVARLLECRREAQVAALASVWCRVEDADPAGPSPRRSPWRRFRSPRAEAGAPGERVGVVSGADGLRVWADERAVGEAAALFREAGLRLLALDGEACAIASLADALATDDAQCVRRQALSAVAVMPEADAAAEALGEDLAVPVGLALAWFAGGSRRAR